MNSRGEGEVLQDTLSNYEDEKKGIHNKGLEQYYAHRKLWSWFILGWITLLILFSIGLTLGIGLNWLNFDRMQWFVTSVTAETFAQIVGLGYVAARYLFSHEEAEDKRMRKKLLSSGADAAGV